MNVKIYTVQPRQAEKTNYGISIVSRDHFYGAFVSQQHSKHDTDNDLQLYVCLIEGKVSLQDGLFHPNPSGMNPKRIFLISTTAAGQETNSIGTLTSSNSLIRLDSRLRSLLHSELTVKPSPAMYYTRVDMPR